jgi:hypothetical protein
VFTPFARVLHVEGGTRGYELTPAERARLAREEERFRARWHAVLATPDPAHHPLLARAGNAFALAPQAAAPELRIGWRVPVAVPGGRDDGAPR